METTIGLGSRIYGLGFTVNGKENGRYWIAVGNIVVILG